MCGLYLCVSLCRSLSLHVSFSACLRMCLSVPLYFFLVVPLYLFYVSVSLSVPVIYLCISLYGVCLCVYVSECLSFCLPVFLYLSMCLLFGSLYISAAFSLCLFVCLCVNLSVCIFFFCLFLTLLIASKNVLSLCLKEEHEKATPEFHGLQCQIPSGGLVSQYVGILSLLLLLSSPPIRAVKSLDKK